MYKIGDQIEFDFFGQLVTGKIVIIGKHGYWVDSTEGCVGTGYKRCPFNKARLRAQNSAQSEGDK